MHQCAVCPKSFPSPSKLRRHYLIHTGHRPFRCGFCWKAFTQSHHLKLHLQNVHRSRAPADRDAIMPPSVPTLPQRSSRAACLPASKTGNLDKFGLQAHLKTHLGSENKCPLFHANARGEKRLSDDSKISRLQSEASLQCPSNNHNSSVELKLKCKLRVNALHKMNKDEIKANSFVKQEKLSNPNRQSHKSRGQGSLHLTDQHVKRFSSSICNRSFCPEVDLIHHRKIHLNQKKLGNPRMSHSDTKKICRVPQEAFPPAEQKRASVPLQRLNASRQCPSCSKCFPSPSKLRRHMMIHTGERPFSCELCNKGFRQKVHLRVHSCVHRALYINRPPSRTGGSNARTAADIPIQEVSALKKRNETFTGSDVTSVKRPHQTPSIATVQNNVKTKSGSQLFPVTFKESDILPLGAVPTVKENWTQTAKPVCSQTPCKLESREVLGLFRPETGVNSLCKTNANSRTFKKKLHTCRVCGKNFPSPYKLSRHLLTHSGVRPYKCSFCSKTLTQRSHLKLHERTCRQRGRLPDCSPTEAVNTVLEKSLKEENIELELKTNQATDSSSSLSDQCGSTFPSQLAFEADKLVQNQKTSALSYQYKGDTDQGGTDSIKKEEVVDVRFIQTDSPRKDGCGPVVVFECGECSSEFMSEDDLKQHRCPARVRATRSTAKNRCGVCFKHFVTPSKLKRHSLVHTGQRPYNCDICGKTFTQSSHVRTHRRTH